MLCKFPEAGKVKTRIWEDLGMEKAAEIQSQMLHSLVATHTWNPEYVFDVFLREVGRIDHFYEVFGASLSNIYEQPQEEYLGDIMRNTIQTWLSAYEKVAIIGSDCPSMTSDHMSELFKALDEHDVVVWPDYWWGMYVLGMKKAHKELFSDIHYSQWTDFHETVQRAKWEWLKVHVLEKLHDIDMKEDLQYL